MKKICFIIPSLTSGGLERVMSELAHYFITVDGIDLSVIALVKGNRFYNIPENIPFYEPSFNHRKYNRIIFTIKIFFFLRKKLKEVKPEYLLTFGGKYNSFVLLAAQGLGIKSFISERSRPSISYGKFLDLLNPVVYRKANGIIAQTAKAKEVIFRKTSHANIKVIGNPIKFINTNGEERENIILNVGRFIKSKNQELLIKYFAEINPEGWKLIFLGDGKGLESAKKLAAELNLTDRVIFKGVASDIECYYGKSKIFAFTSTSEGFPNVLGEALSAGLACISFDCEAGPSDLIEDGVNGFLVRERDHEDYKAKLKRLIEDENLRESFEREALKRIQQYHLDIVGKKYLDFLFQD